VIWSFGRAGARPWLNNIDALVVSAAATMLSVPQRLVHFTDYLVASIKSGEMRRTAGLGSNCACATLAETSLHIVVGDAGHSQACNSSLLLSKACSCRV